MTVSIKQIAELVSGQIVGDPGIFVTGVSSISEAGPGDIVFADSRKHLEDAQRSDASAILTRETPSNGGKPVIVVPNPRVAFSTVLGLFSPEKDGDAVIADTARISPSARIADGVGIGHCTYIGEGVTIGNGTRIMPFCYIGEGVQVGEGCRIQSNVTLYPGAIVGNRVILHAGCRIGADGFGYNMSGGRHQKVPHIGGVILGDDVEVGANSTIDRARTGYTEIGEGTKIDNLVHVAHNVKIGKHCIIVAQVGISGSVTVGDYCVIAGQVGVKDNIVIGNRVQVGAQSGVISNISDDEKVSGTPPRPHREAMRVWASLHKLPDLVKQIAELEKQLEDLRNTKLKDS